ncbi:asparagine synthase (glutamine-hydrolyzing) [Candidatus Woesearchaeota archaeon]|nr:asparagine synthase (glutamine-hydrolyzing) [Candidatus Woesearchaeota archaeon]
MCGIAGFNWSDKSLIKSMTDSLILRGPNDSGFYVDKEVSIGSRRLSIIDLSKKGKQPISNEDGTKWIVFNGEIYNFLELKNELQKKGHRFRSDTDTEVIVHSYEEYGEKCVEKFNGMFAFAIWDSKKKELFIARDRLGVKPLFYCKNEKKFIFASEIKAIFRANIKKTIDEEALYFYLKYGYTPKDKSIFKDIFKLEPGCTLTLSKAIKIKRYWKADFSQKIAKNEEFFVSKIREYLDSSVKKRLIADVPVGAFLSGGLDSSAIVAYISKYKKDLKTFSVGFDYEQYNESKYAKIVSEKFETEHHEVYFSSNDAIKQIPFLVRYYDEPFADPSMIPTYMVSKVARKYVTVSLSGDGGDESFLGYNRYLYYKYISLQDKIPKAISKYMLKPLFSSLSHLSDKGVFHKAKQYLHFNELPDYERYSRLRSTFSQENEKNLFNGNYDFSLYYKPYFVYRNYLDNLSNADINTYLADDILTKLDRASMSVSLEARVPFLDYKFIEFSSKIPASLKLRGKETKYILKKSLMGILPKNIIYRKKQGFAFPLDIYLRNELKDSIKSSLTEKSELLEQHYKKEKNHANGLWAIYILKLWLDEFCKC